MTRRRLLRSWLALIAFPLLSLLYLFLAGGGRAETSPPYEERGMLLAAQGAPQDRFGAALSADGATAAIGAPGWNNNGQGIYIGSAFVFERGSGGWSQVKRLVAADGAIGDTFGNAVAVSGDTVAIGADGDNRNEPGTPGFTSDVGSVYLYARAGADWTLQQKLSPAELTAEMAFGWSLDLDADTLIVGAYGWSAGADEAAFIFRRSGSTWTQEERLLPADGSPGNFGYDVAVAGNTALVGATGVEGFAKPAGEGVVTVYKRTGSTWSPAGTIAPTAPAEGNAFGCAIDFDGQTAVIVACGSNTIDDFRDVAYVFTTDGTSWTQQAILESAVASNIGDVAREGDRIALASADGSGPTAAGVGAVYVFQREGANWVEAAAVQPAEIQENDWFPSAVALTSDELLVGASNRTNQLNPKQGAVYVFGPPLALNHALYLPVALSPALGGPDGLIAYSASVNGEFDLFVTRPDGTGKTNLSRSTDSELGASWSPDGSRVVVSRSAPGKNAELVIFSLDGAAPVVVQTSVGASYPAWSPDGETIAFVGEGKETGYDYEIYTIGADGTGQKRLTTLPGEDSEPAWSPDGARIVFSRLHAGNKDLAVMDAGGANFAYLTETSAWENAPRWSPDGKTILFWTMHNGGPTLFTLPAAGGAARLVLGSARDGRWSPAGERIVFVGGGGGIFTARADGAGLLPVDTTSSATHPDWQPTP